MTRKEITLLNLGKNLDDLANLDPRGYGVCKLLYKAAYNFTGKPLCLNSAELLCDVLKKGGMVYILTGFVLAPFNKAETDGVISSVLLASVLEKIFGVKTVLICPEEAVCAVKKLSETVGEKSEIIVFTKDTQKADKMADDILSSGYPDAVISIECPGANKNGVYHNAAGADVSALEAKTDILFDKLIADENMKNVKVFASRISVLNHRRNNENITYTYIDFTFCQTMNSLACHNYIYFIKI